METISDFVAVFGANLDKYSRIEKHYETLFKDELQHTKFLWQSRVKDPASLEKKLRDRSHQTQYKNEAANVAKVMDLVGVRIILAHLEDVSRIEKFVKKTFKLVHRTQHPTDNINIVDSGKRFRGYNALHLYVTLQSRSDEQYWNPVVEIQVMTAFMWVYATLQHDVVYKKLSGEPTPKLLKAIDMLRGLANVGELATEIYDRQLITLKNHSKLQSRIESAIELDAGSQSVLQPTSPQHNQHRVELSIAQESEDPASEKRAFVLIRNQAKDKATHLEGVAEARRILLQRIAMFSNDGPSSIGHLRELHDLAVAERKLSLKRGLNTEKVMKHLDDAEGYIDKIVASDIISGLPGAREQMTLERHIVRGLRAKLEFQMHVTSVRNFQITCWLLSVASAGIKKALEDLKKVDDVEYEKNRKFGLEWIDYFGKFDTRYYCGP